MPEGLRTWDSYRTQGFVNKEEQFPQGVLYRKWNLVQINSPEIERKSYERDKSRSISEEILNHWIYVTS